jgi:hypothetical protein
MFFMFSVVSFGPSCRQEQYVMSLFGMLFYPPGQLGRDVHMVETHTSGVSRHDRWGRG